MTVGEREEMVSVNTIYQVLGCPSTPTVVVVSYAATLDGAAQKVIDEIRGYQS
jgi:hypothetical protein